MPRDNSASIGRKRPTHGVQIKSGNPTIVFLTVCTKNRDPWLLEPGVRESIIDSWQKADAWLVGFYLLMPDHLHLFCAPRDSSHTLAAWVRYWKSDFSRKHLTEDWHWQRDYWDTRLRRHEGYLEKWKYIQQNPARKGLVNNPADWPHQGQLNPLRW